MAKKRTSENERVMSQGGPTTPARRKTAAAPHKKHTPATSISESLAVSESFADPAVPRKPGHAEISALAYSYWAARGYQGGSAEEDWQRAEEELSRATQPVTA